MKKETENRKNNHSNTISVLALIISILSVYFSVFYKNYNLTVSVIDSNVKYSNNLIELDLLFHNRGNTYSTTINEYITFYQSKDWENKGVIFDNGKASYKLNNNPIILKADEQILKQIKTKANFNNIDESYSRKLNYKEKIKVGLVMKYINSNGLLTSELFDIGYIILNENKLISRYKINYDNFNLNSWNYYGSKGNE